MGGFQARKQTTKPAGRGFACIGNLISACFTVGPRLAAETHAGLESNSFKMAMGLVAQGAGEVSVLQQGVVQVNGVAVGLRPGPPAHPGGQGGWDVRAAQTGGSCLHLKLAIRSTGRVPVQFKKKRAGGV